VLLESKDFIGDNFRPRCGDIDDLEPMLRLLIVRPKLRKAVALAG
jgi:hypothetical protein